MDLLVSHLPYLLTDFCVGRLLYSSIINRTNHDAVFFFAGGHGFMEVSFLRSGTTHRKLLVRGKIFRQWMKFTVRICRFPVYSFCYVVWSKWMCEFGDQLVLKYELWWGCSRLGEGQNWVSEPQRWYVCSFLVFCLRANANVRCGLIWFGHPQLDFGILSRDLTIPSGFHAPLWCLVPIFEKSSCMGIHTLLKHNSVLGICLVFWNLCANLQRYGSFC